MLRELLIPDQGIKDMDALTKALNTCRQDAACSEIRHRQSTADFYCQLNRFMARESFQFQLGLLLPMVATLKTAVFQQNPNSAMSVREGKNICDTLNVTDIAEVLNGLAEDLGIKGWCYF